MLRKFPAFLSFDLERHIRPRAEFLRALGVDPLMNGLPYLVSASAVEIAYVTGVKVELFNKFQVAYPELWKNKTNNTEPKPKSSNDKYSRYLEESKVPESALLDEFDSSF